MKKGILERLAEGPVLGDGGYLLELEKRGWVRAGPFTPEVVLNNPDALRQLHVEFKTAGAEVLQALTFYASRDKLATVGLADKLEEMNRTAVRIASDVAGEHVLVSGNLSLTWMYDPEDAASSDRVRKLFDEQLALQIDEGVDFIIGETYSWLGEALLAVERAKPSGLPVMVTLSFENENVTEDGYSVQESAKRLEAAGADIVGVNCLRNPSTTLPLLEEMKSVVSCHLAAQPSAYRTPAEQKDFTALAAFPTELDPLQMTRSEMASYASDARDAGVGYIGACCGAVATHIRAMAIELQKRSPDESPWKVYEGRAMSAFEFYGHDREKLP